MCHMNAVTDSIGLGHLPPSQIEDYRDLKLDIYGALYIIVRIFSGISND